MPKGGNTQDDDGPERQIDRWDALLEQIASDVSKIRAIVVMAWWFSWFALAVLVITSDVFR